MTVMSVTSCMYQHTILTTHLASLTTQFVDLVDEQIIPRFEGRKACTVMISLIRTEDALMNLTPL